MKRLILTALILPFMTLVIGGCSDKSSNPNNQDPPTEQKGIGPEGGVVQIAGHIILTIPPGALANKVEFTLTENSSPAAPDGGREMVSPCFTIGPSGTTFALESQLMIHYDQADLGTREIGAAIFLHNSSGWQRLTTESDTLSNISITAISSLGDFAVMVDSPITSQGIYAQLEISRTVINLFGSVWRTDVAQARFDGTYAPCGPISPLQPDSVHLNQFNLDWDPADDLFRYDEGFDSPFIQLGASYTYRIKGNSSIPDLSASITFPSGDPYITYPLMGDTLSRSGFTVRWENPGGGTVQLAVVNADDTTAIDIVTENDGSYSFAQSQLSDLPEGDYGLVLFYNNMAGITAPGFDSRSVIWARVISTAMFYLR